MNSDLFLAILSMDAYNRVGGDVTNFGLKVDGTRIGNAVLGASLGANSSSFFAQAYNIQDGSVDGIQNGST